MKAFLLYRDRDLDPAADLLANEAALRQDLELDRLFSAMAAGDPFLFEVAKQVVMTSLGEPELIVYRQDILTDCLAQPKVTREIYDLAVEAIAGEKGAHHWLYARSADGLLSESIKVLELFVSMLRRLRHIAEQHALAFHSEGFTRLFTMLARELDDEYLEEVEAHLARLRFRDGIRISADLGPGNKGIDYVLRRSPDPSQSRLRRLFARDRSGYVYEIAERDEAGLQALSELRGRGTSLVASALGRSMSDILSFFAMLRSELGFYVGCLNLFERLSAKGEPICFPEPVPAGRPMLAGRGLYDVCLSLSMAERVVGNDMSADGKSLVMITGANRGGKSTFLRSIGLAQLMMQCGMFVTAEAFRADVRAGIFTHFRREEDASMRRGKLDEELSRMSSVVDDLMPNSLVLLNESFASTNEREGSEIARQIVGAFVDTGVKVFYVTHMFDLAHGFYVQKMAAALFLRAERRPAGERTFRVVEGEPLPTSYGEDLYRRIFGAASGAATMAAPGTTPGRPDAS